MEIGPGENAPSHWSVGRQVGNKNACLLVHMEVLWTIEITNTNEYKRTQIFFSSFGGSDDDNDEFVIMNHL